MTVHYLFHICEQMGEIIDAILQQSPVRITAEHKVYRTALIGRDGQKQQAGSQGLVKTYYAAHS